MANPKKSRQLDKEQVDKLNQEWNNCLPSSISNLFYEKHDKTGIQRVSYFSLNLDDADYDTIRGFWKEFHGFCIIRIIMGCENEKFSPVFELTHVDFQLSKTAQENPPSLYYSLIPNYDTETPKPSLSPIFSYSNTLFNNEDPPSGLTEITPGVADLFHKKWFELSNAKLSAAFSGITHRIDSGKPDTIGQEGQQLLTSKRVQSYVFSQSDTNIVIAYIVNPIYEDSSVRMYMGSGLTMRFTHPFRFRPMLFLPNLQSGMPEVQSDPTDDPDSGTYFERSKPCPPYCDPEG
ncbi:MAG: hypothetical protein R2824_14655 [Saprospiraceae bacterium]|nr:hypothetical protein [Lewinella sp.]